MKTTDIRVQSLPLKARPSASLDRVVVTAASEITDDFDNIRAIDADERLRVLQDKHGSSLLFSIGGDDGLYFLRRTDNRAGWEEIKLSSAFGNHAQVEAFAVGQDERGRITIAASVKEGQASHLYVAYRLSNDPKRMNWEDSSTLKWKDLGVRDHTRIRRLLVNEHQSRPMIVAGTDHPQEGSRLYWVSRRLRKFARAEKVALQVDADTIVDMAAGTTVAYGEGVFTLHRLRDSLQLTFTSPTEFGVVGYQSLPIPKEAVDQGVLRRLQSGKKLNALATLPDEEGYSEVYLGLNGLYRYTVGEIVHNAPASAETVAGNISDILGVHVRRDHPDNKNPRTVAWVVDGQGTLHETFREGSDRMWSEPIAIRKNVSQLAAFRHRHKATNELFIVRNDNSLAHLWQDPETRIWTENPVTLEDYGKTDVHKAYLTKLTLETVDGAPVQRAEVKLSASAWCYVKVNGRTVVLEPGVKNRLTVTPDAMGSITIVNRTESLSPPVYRLSADWLTEAAEINPAAPLLARLAGLTADDLLKARRRESQPGEAAGAPLLKAKMRSDDQRETVQAAAHALGQLASSTDSNGHKPVLLRRLNATEARAPMKSIRQPVFDSGPWKMEFSDSGLASVPTLPEPERTGLLADIGDFLESLGEGLLKVGSLVVEAVREGWRFVCKVAGKVWDFVVDTAEQIGKACMWLFEKIEVVWNDIVDWLGMFFNWEDIARTRDFLSGMVENTLRYGEKATENLKDPINRFFDQADAWISDIVGAEDTRPASESGAISSAMKKMQDSSANSLGQKAKGLSSMMKTNPVMSFMMDKVFKAISESLIKLEPPEDSGPHIGNVMMQQVLAQMDVVETLVNRIHDHGKEAFGDLKLDASLFSDPTLPDRIKQFGIDLGGDILRALLESVRTLVTGIIDLIGAMVRGIRVLLTTKVSSPLIQSIADFITKLSGSEPVELKTSILDLMMMLIAVPATLLAKIVTGEAPVKEGQTYVSAEEAFAKAQSDEDKYVINSYISGWASVVTSIYGVYSQTYVVSKTFNEDTQEFDSDLPSDKEKQTLSALDNIDTVVSFLSLILLVWNKGVGLESYEDTQKPGDNPAKANQAYSNELRLGLATVGIAGISFLMGLPKFMGKHPQANAVKGIVTSLTSIGLAISGPVTRGIIAHRVQDRSANAHSITQACIQGLSGVGMNVAKLKKVPPKVKAVLVPFSMIGGVVGMFWSIGRFVDAHENGTYAEIIYGMPPDW